MMHDRSCRLEFWFEFASTYSYLSAMRVQRLAQAAGVGLDWRPFLLGPVFAAQGLSDSPFNLYESKGRYMWRDLERLCEKEGLDFRRPSRFPRNGLLAARIACRGQQQPWCADFVRAVFRSNFARDEEISDRGLLRAILESLGQPADNLLGVAESEANKDQLRSQTARAQSLGIFGAPSFVVGGELFWGNDRLEEAIAWCKRGRGSRDR